MPGCDKLHGAVGSNKESQALGVSLWFSQGLGSLGPLVDPNEPILTSVLTHWKALPILWSW